MAPQERTEIVDDEIVQTLEHSRQEFIAAVAGVTEPQAKVRPNPERWSVLECVEHVTRVEELFLGRLEAAGKLDAPRVDKQKEAGIMVRLTDRSTLFQAPETAWPTGRFATLAQAMEQFNAGRTRSIRFAQDRSGDLYSLAAEHRRFGTVNGVEYLMIAAAHARRHAAQIHEIRAALDKP